MQSPLRRCNRHLALSAHHLQTFADRLLALCRERPEIIDVSCETAGLGRVGQRQAGAGERLDRHHSATSLDKSGPQFFEREAQR